MLKKPTYKQKFKSDKKTLKILAIVKRNVFVLSKIKNYVR